mmetsp:Transcript_18795/g.34271  ORF Transcript_18795/g.34271 Transcript_18795/m.34271 type:complete len:116 (-) Transcript_18795:22-369(-)
MTSRLDSSSKEGSGIDSIGNFRFSAARKSSFRSHSRNSSSFAALERKHLIFWPCAGNSNVEIVLVLMLQDDGPLSILQQLNPTTRSNFATRTSTTIRSENDITSNFLLASGYCKT